MSRVFDQMKRFFDSDDWGYDQDEDRPGVLTMSFKGDDGTWRCLARAREEQEQAVFYSIAPVSVPEHRRAEMAEFLTRANYGMIIGNFEMDLSDGEVRYKTAIDVEGAELTPPLMKGIVYPNVYSMDRYLKGIMAVSFGNISAIEAIRDIEK